MGQSGNEAGEQINLELRKFISITLRKVVLKGSRVDIRVCILKLFWLPFDETTVFFFSYLMCGAKKEI